ncbi:MAG: hypothetical protein IPO27_12365 [Bacteroidetes bacterium]|nr:hypothetical protein [Bacteroidota bacterium]
MQTSQANYWGILNVPYTPQVIGGKFGSTYNLFTNDNGWDLIENTFIAQGGEQYLTIGVFDRINGQKVHVPVIGDTTWLPEAYYYIDDVSITEEPYCLHSCKINLPAIVLDPDPNQQIQSMACIPNVHPMSIQIDNAIAYRLTIYNSFGAPLYNFYEFNPNGFPYPWFVNWNGEDDYGNGVQSDLYAATLEMWNCNAGGTMINFHIYSNGFNGQPVHIPPVTDIPFNSGFSCCEYDKYYQDYIFN